tara:strand:- start:22 stop:228 length:207 start_codon:yes stop_codon:yes gene_type:complete
MPAFDLELTAAEFEFLKIILVDTKHEYEKCQRDFLADSDNSKYHPNAKGSIERSIERVTSLKRKIDNI